MWAVEHANVEPDIIISAKGLASGLPLGAFMARADLMETWSAGAHGSTYGGSPIPCAAGIATLEVLTSENLLANAADQGDFLISGLRELRQKYPGLITGVRGTGLMIGVEFRTAEEAEEVQRQAFERGLLVLECGERSIRISPPLVVSMAQASTGLQLLGEAMHAVAS